MPDALSLASLAEDGAPTGSSRAALYGNHILRILRRIVHVCLFILDVYYPWHPVYPPHTVSGEVEGGGGVLRRPCRGRMRVLPLPPPPAIDSAMS